MLPTNGNDNMPVKTKFQLSNAACHSEKRQPGSVHPMSLKTNDNVPDSHNKNSKVKQPAPNLKHK